MKLGVGILHPYRTLATYKAQSSAYPIALS